MSGRVWLGDLIRVVQAIGIDHLELAVALGGIDLQPWHLAPVSGPSVSAAPPLGRNPPLRAPDGPRAPETRLYWRATNFVSRTPLSVPNSVSRAPAPPPIAPTLPADQRPFPVSPLLSTRSRISRVIDEWLREERPSHGLHAGALIRRISNGRPFRRIPRRSRRAWTSKAAVLLDVNLRLAPVRVDQVSLLAQLQRARGRRGLHVEPIDAIPGEHNLEQILDNTGHGSPILALSDLGHYRTREYRDGWRELGRALCAKGRTLRALVPVPSRRWFSSLATLWNAAPWEPELTAPGNRYHSKPWDLAHELLSLLSLAGRIEPGLLREVRLLLSLSGADVGTELDAWNSPLMRGVFETAGTLDENWAKKERQRFVPASDRELGTMERACVDLLREWRRSLPPEIWHREVLELAALSPDWLRGDEVVRAEAFFRDLHENLEKTTDCQRSDVLAFIRRMNDWAGEGLWRSPGCQIALRELWELAHQGQSHVSMPASIMLPIAAATLSDRVSILSVCELHGQWQIGRQSNRTHPLGFLSGHGTLVRVLRDDLPPLRLDIAQAPTRIPHRAESAKIVVSTDLEEMAFRALPKPEWAVSAGRDRYGMWADLEVRGVVQRMRWIPPGSYVQGSPEVEAGRSDYEGPQRRVILSAGYWLGETAVTQELFGVIMKSNPSRFKSDDRPVERVGFETVEIFVANVRKNATAFHARLPSEAEWEYACRAGTTMATYVGDLEIKGAKHAPVLDRIAWYGGNAGVNFELGSKGSRLADRAERHHDQYEYGGTHPVKRKEPNGWGLYDMLGNVWEFCQDRTPGPPRNYPASNVGNANAASIGDKMIVRGGSWFSNARSVRSAARSVADWNFSSDHLGFRLAEGLSEWDQAT